VTRDPAAADAAEAGLRYVTDARPGFTRRRAGRGFAYLDPDGRRITDDETLRRIRSLAIPPAWTDVWICPTPLGHLQATGRDARGRKQYRYHPEFRRRRDAGKYDRLIALGERLPALRRRVDRDLGRHGLPRDRVLAAVVRLLERTALRVGNEEYARLNRSFGLSTLRNRHVRVARGSIQFRFRGKAGKTVQVDVDDRRLAAVVRRCQELPGQALFEYVDGGRSVDADARPQAIGSDDVNEYIRAAIGGDFSAKDLRTWAGTMLAFRAMRAAAAGASSGAEAAATKPAASRAGGAAGDAKAVDPRKVVVDAIRETAAALGNTPAVARASYVHPAVLEAGLDEAVAAAPPAAVGPTSRVASRVRHTDRAEELALLRLLRARKAASDRGGRRRDVRAGTVTRSQSTASPSESFRGQRPSPPHGGAARVDGHP
jgi:DNA topoisomerase-1